MALKRFVNLIAATSLAVSAVAGEHATILQGKGIRLSFDTEGKGFNCIGIENRVNPESAAFCGEKPGYAAFWSLTFWKDGAPTNALTIDNLAPCERKVVRRGDALVFDWRGLSLGDEHGVVDVRTKVSLSQGGAAAEWRIAVKNRSKRWGLAETTYPLLRNVVKPMEANVLISKGNWAGRLVKSYRGEPLVGGSSLRYPTSLGVQVQTCAYMVGGAGLQITSLDGRGQVKYFDMPEFDFGIRYTCPDQGVPGAANAPGFAVETAAFSGDWWTAAKRYRAWATRQKWAAKGPLATRADFNRQLGDVGYWMKTDWKTATPQLVTNLMARAMERLPGIPLGLHWYCWQQCPFDNNYPEMLPERPGMKEAVSWMKEKGILVMPYINGRLWDDVLESYANAVPSAVKNTDGTCYIDKYGGHKFAVMCPTTKTWQMKLDELCDTMENDLGVNALYLDQVSASMPAPCYDRSHGHPLGGGSHWTEGYRKLMEPIREKAFKRGVALTSENAAEPYMDSFDAHLTWFGHSFDDVPMLPAVYSGYTVYFSSVSDEKDSLDSFCAQQGRDFIFGCQIGWNDPWILDDEHKEHLKFVERLSRERIAHKEFFLTGELMGELPTPPDMPTVDVKWNRIGMYYSSTPFKMPAVLGAEWRDHKGERRYVVFVNISGDEQTFSYGEGANRKTVTLPPRSVSSDICRMHNPFKVQLPDEPKPWEKTAAEELEHYLALCLGGNPLTVEGLDGVVFHVGDTAFARENLRRRVKDNAPCHGMADSQSAANAPVLQDEEWCVRSFGRDVVLAGGGMRGTLYAVYHFLEDDCGVRWWMDGDEDVPPARPLAFAALKRRGKPFFACRNIYRFGSSDPRTAVRNRLNDNGSSPIPAELGGAFTYGPPDLAHTWDMYLPFEKHGAEHPEWYSLVGGKRIGGQHVAQMCLTCPGLADEFSRRLEEFIAKGEAEAASKGLPAPRIYDISMNDNMRFCQCEACAEETAKYGHSGRQLRFVNAIAERAAASHPDLLFSTFAYYYSEPPPSNGVRAADNVVVRLCNTRQNMAAGIFDDDNRFMHDQVLAWGKFTRNLFVWDYGVTYGKGKGYPFPNESYIFEKFRFYADNGVTGFLVEHESPECADMYELKYWLECKAMENPYSDPKPLIKDFMTRFYGAARDNVWKARRLLDRRRREKGAFISWFPTTGEFNFISDDDLVEFEHLFNEAAAAVKGDERREARVERAYASIRRLTDFRRKFGARHPPEEGVSGKPFFDFPARSGNWVLYDTANVAYVKDPDLGDPLEGGETVIRFKADGDALYRLPFELGVYDLANRQTVALKTWEKPLGPGYFWYSIGRVTLPERSFLAYATRKWTAQLPISLPGMNGSTFEVKALVKFTGPMFFEGSAEPNEIRVARLAYVEP